MIETAELTLLALMAAFCLKHWVADFLLQTARMVQEKGHYGRLGGLLHAGTHGLCTAFVLLLFWVPFSLAVMIVFAEVAVHYHIDFAKERLSRWLGDTPAVQRFWIVLGLDQMLHHLTYAAMIVMII